MDQPYFIGKFLMPVVRGGATFEYAIHRNFATNYEPVGAIVFYFMEEDEAEECLSKLLES